MLGAPLQLGALSVRLVRLWVNPVLSRVRVRTFDWYQNQRPGPGMNTNHIVSLFANDGTSYY